MPPVNNFFEENHEKVWWNGKKCVPLHPLKKNDAPVAQLVEHLTLNQGVQGSSPCGCTIQRIADMAQLVEQRIRNA